MAIQRSALLSADRKRALLAALPSLTPAQADELRRLLAQETELAEGIADHAIGLAVARKDEDALRALDAFLRDSTHSLSRTQEGAERIDESDQLQHFFDAA